MVCILLEAGDEENQGAEHGPPCPQRGFLVGHGHDRPVQPELLDPDGHVGEQVERHADGIMANPHPRTAALGDERAFEESPQALK